jgi:uncharacterized membrane protein YfcA
MLDIETIYVVNVSMAFVMSAISLYYWFQHPDVRGLRGWAIGLFVGGLGGIVLNQRTPATSIVLGVTGGSWSSAAFPSCGRRCAGSTAVR